MMWTLIVLLMVGNGNWEEKSYNNFLSENSCITARGAAIKIDVNNHDIDKYITAFCVPLGKK